jgi:hypothetical protein
VGRADSQGSTGRCYGYRPAHAPGVPILFGNEDHRQNVQTLRPTQTALTLGGGGDSGGDGGRGSRKGRDARHFHYPEALVNGRGFAEVRCGTCSNRNRVREISRFLCGPIRSRDPRSGTSTLCDNVEIVRLWSEARAARDQK